MNRITANAGRHVSLDGNRTPKQNARRNRNRAGMKRRAANNGANMDNRPTASTMRSSIRRLRIRVLMQEPLREKNRLSIPMSTPITAGSIKIPKKNEGQTIRTTAHGSRRNPDHAPFSHLSSGIGAIRQKTRPAGCGKMTDGCRVRKPAKNEQENSNARYPI